MSGTVRDTDGVIAVFVMPSPDMTTPRWGAASLLDESAQERGERP